MTRPLALRKVIPPAPEPVALEQLAYQAEQFEALAQLLAGYLSDRDEADALGATQLLADGLGRHAALLRAFMHEPD